MDLLLLYINVFQLSGIIGSLITLTIMYFGIIFLISMVGFASSSVPIRSLQYVHLFGYSLTIGDYDTVEPTSLANFRTQENDTLSEEEDASVMPMILSGIIIVFLVMIISYFTLKPSNQPF